MDLDALREAVRRFDQARELEADGIVIYGDSPIVAAARAVLNSKEVWRCETHSSDFLEREPDEYAMCLGMLYEDRWDTLPEPDPCKPVRRRLLAEEEHVGELDQREEGK